MVVMFCSERSERAVNQARRLGIRFVGVGRGARHLTRELGNVRLPSWHE